MRKKRKTAFEEILEALTEAAAIARGETKPARVYVSARTDVSAKRVAASIKRRRERRKPA